MIAGHRSLLCVHSESRVGAWLIGRPLVAFIVACAAAFVVGSSSRASAQDVVPGPWGDLVDHVRPLTIESDNQRVVLFRRQHMRAQSAHFRAIEAVVKYNAPFRSTINSDAVALQALARRLDTLFPPGTAMQPGTYGAKPEIWLQPDKFAQHVSGFRKAVDDLVLATASGDDVSAAFTAVRHQCLACHQVFRLFQNRR